MIPNQWYAVLESKEVRPGKPLGVTAWARSSSRVMAPSWPIAPAARRLKEMVEKSRQDIGG